MSGARCRLAYGPADATATHCLLLHKIQIGFTFLVLAYPGSPGKEPLNGVCVCVCVPWHVSGGRCPSGDKYPVTQRVEAASRSVRLAPRVVEVNCETDCVAYCDMLTLVDLTRDLPGL